MIFAPPRHGKTELVTKKFPSWLVCSNPDKRIIIASHGAELAEGFSREARDLVVTYGPETFGVTVRGDRFAENNWGVVDRDGRARLGGMRAFGVGGGMLGEGADLLIIDDPITGKDSMSPAMRDMVWQWWLSTARNRLNPGGKSAVILMMQRLNVDDLAGKLLADSRDDWDVISFPAEAEEDDILGRRPGEWLWPWGFPPKDYEQLKRGDPYWWATQYQQRPVPRGGGMFQTRWIEDNAVVEAPAGIDSRVRRWDCAATEGGGDYTAGVKMGRLGSHYYIEDVRREQFGSGRRDALIRSTCDLDNALHPHAIVTWREQEPGSAGKDGAEAFARMLVPYAARVEVSSGSKETRAEGLAAAFSRGEVHVCKGTAGHEHGWYRPLVEELSNFPAGKHDDIVDACAGAFNKLALAKRAINDYAYSLPGEAEGWAA